MVTINNNLSLMKAYLPSNYEDAEPAKLLHNLELFQLVIKKKRNWGQTSIERSILKQFVEV